MKSTYPSRPAARATEASPAPVVVPLVLVAALAIGNILSNRVAPDGFYVPLNLAIAAVVYLVVSRAVTPIDVGLTRWRRGARWGAFIALSTIAVYLVALALPPLRDLFDDSRVRGGPDRMVFEVLVRIPFGTVLLEELAFRGALPAVFSRWWSTPRAVVGASFLFGLWHVLPALSLGEVNPVLAGILGDGTVGQFAGVVFAVAGTFLAGLWLCLLRYGSGSLLAPALAHVASNSLAYTIAWFVTGGVSGTLLAGGDL